jgi:hypothetical protein
MNKAQVFARLGVALVAWLAASAIALAANDGPYVVRTGDGLAALSVEAGADGAHPVVTKVARDARLTVPAVGSVPAFKVRLRPPAAPAPDSVNVTPSTSIFVVADTHGEFAILAQMLQSQKVVDSRLQWAFGRGHLVVLGDVFDRGPNHLEILWLLYELEVQAAKAGGGVHLVLGNHETMVLQGDLRYLNPKYVDTARDLGIGYPALFAADTVLGQWLRSKPVMFMIGGNLCLHGGVSRALVDRNLSLAQINATARAALSGVVGDDVERERAEFLFSPLGPLWYRGYFADQRDFPTATAADVSAVLEQFGVRRILVGHTIVPAITPLYDGKVIAVQVYPKHDDVGNVSFESLLVRGDRLFRAMPDGKVEELGR